MLDFEPSFEQHIILDERDADPGQSMRVVACAGAGKTKTLELLAAVKPVKTLYLVFNSTTKDAASRRFPGNVECRTPHSIAYRALRMWEQDARLKMRLMGRDVADLCDIPALDGFTASRWGQWVIEAVSQFTHSTDREIGPRHVTGLPAGSTRVGDVVAWARRLWAEMADSQGSVPITHDCYIKMAHLNGVELDRHLELLLVDEAQDLNPVILEMVLRARCPKILVGDPKQRIYRFRKAVDAMSVMDAPLHPLSQSWRFGPIIAQICNAILWHHPERPSFAIKGNRAMPTEIGDVGLDGRPHTIICRTNAGVFERAIEGGDRVHILGGAEPLIKLLMGGYNLLRGGRAPDVPALCRFQSYDDMAIYAEESNDAELRLLTRVIKEHGAKVPDLADDLKRRAVLEAGAADRVLGTCHKVKGLEFDQVALHHDFYTLDDLNKVDEQGRPEWSDEERADELNLLYVAASRARRRFKENEAVRSCVSAWRSQRAERKAA